MVAASVQGAVPGSATITIRVTDPQGTPCTLTAIDVQLPSGCCLRDVPAGVQRRACVMR